MDNEDRGSAEKAADAGGGDRRARLRTRAAALGILRAAPPVRPVSPADRERIIATMKGIGPIADRLIAEQREIAGFRAPT